MDWSGIVVRGTGALLSAIMLVGAGHLLLLAFGVHLGNGTLAGLAFVAACGAFAALSLFGPGKEER